MTVPEPQPQTHTDHARSETHPEQREGAEKLGWRASPDLVNREPLPTEEGEVSLTLGEPDSVFIFSTDNLFVDFSFALTLFFF